MLKRMNTPFIVPILLGLTWVGVLSLIWIKSGVFPSINTFALVSLFIAPQLYFGFKNALDKRKGIPLKDEMSRMVEIHASAYAFRISLWVWFAIYFFRSEFPDLEKLILYGILSSMFILGIARFYLRRVGIPNAK